MDHTPALAFLKDEAGRYVYVNKPSEITQPGQTPVVPKDFAG
jgi:hypothetical protein